MDRVSCLEAFPSQGTETSDALVLTHQAAQTSFSFLFKPVSLRRFVRSDSELDSASRLTPGTRLVQEKVEKSGITQRILWLLSTFGIIPGFSVVPDHSWCHLAYGW